MYARTIGPFHDDGHLPIVTKAIFCSIIVGLIRGSIQFVCPPSSLFAHQNKTATFLRFTGICDCERVRKQPSRNPKFVCEKPYSDVLSSAPSGAQRAYFYASHTKVRERAYASLRDARLDATEYMVEPVNSHTENDILDRFLVVHGHLYKSL